MAARREDYDIEPPAPPSGGGKELTIMEHLLELRNRLFISALAVAIGTIVGLIFSKWMIKFLERPALQVHPKFQTQTIEPLEFVGAYFKVALLMGLALAMPVLIYELLAFIVPGLTKRERRWLFPILGGTIGLFVIGVLFSYYLVLPRTLDFLLNFGNDVAPANIRIGSYVNVVVHLIFWTGVIFELPMIMMAPAKFGIIGAGRYLKWWRYAIVLGFVAAAAVIPNINPLEQVMVAIPVIGLYFVGVFLAWLVQPKDKNKGASDITGADA